MIYVLFIIGFILLVKGADWLVSSASIIARKFGVSDLVVGLTIVSMGTSLPELTVNIMASFAGNADIAIGNVFGSNIANILLILGISSIVANLPVQRDTVVAEIPFSLMAILLIGFLANSSILVASDADQLDQREGLVIMGFFIMFMFYIIEMAMRDKAALVPNYDEVPDKEAIWKHVLMIIAGIAGLYVGGRWVVDGAVHIATLFGLSEAFIGLTIIAIGTSLPELVTSVVAAYRGNADIAVGNVVGSNIFNLLWVLGLSALIRPLPFNRMANEDIYVIIGASVMLIMAFVILRRYIISRWVGVVFLATYTLYLYYLVQRG
jgi:cation:H+ antiporter